MRPSRVIFSEIRTTVFGLSQPAFGRRLGLTEWTVSKLENETGGHRVLPKHVRDLRDMRPPNGKAAVFAPLIAELNDAVAAEQQARPKKLRAQGKTVAVLPSAGAATLAAVPPVLPVVEPSPASVEPVAVAVVAAVSPVPPVLQLAPVAAVPAAAAVAVAMVAAVAPVLPAVEPAPAAAPTPPAAPPARVSRPESFPVSNQMPGGWPAHALTPAMGTVSRNASAPADSAPRHDRCNPVGVAACLAIMCAADWAAALHFGRDSKPSPALRPLTVAPSVPMEDPSYTASASVEMDGRGARHPLPSQPFKAQRVGPCDPDTHDELINGGCWTWTGATAPCRAKEFEYGGKCYLPKAADPKTPVTFEPDAGIQ